MNKMLKNKFKQKKGFGGEINMSEKILLALQNSLIALNKEASKNHRKKIKNFGKVHIGRSPSLDSFIEIKIANELSKVYPFYDFYIDYPITLLDDKLEQFVKKQQPIYPDIMVIDRSKKELRAIIEIKLDLGHLNIDRIKDSKREEKILNAKNLRFNEVVGRYSKNECKAKKEILKISPSLQKIILIITKKNEHSYNGVPKSKKYIEVMKELGYEVIFLLDTIHFNTFENNSKIIVREIQDKRDLILNAFRGIK